jgi:glycine/D-amino acid oxidase-like deaminating enzyme
MRDGLPKIDMEVQADAVVIGGGLSGLAAAIHLTRAGLKVICLEPRETFARIIGESLDWSAPLLFAQLGLPMEELVRTGAATFKRHITVTAADGAQEEFPSRCVARRASVERRDAHVTP